MNNHDRYKKVVNQIQIPADLYENLEDMQNVVCGRALKKVKYMRIALLFFAFSILGGTSVYAYNENLLQRLFKTKATTVNEALTNLDFMDLTYTGNVTFETNDNADTLDIQVLKAQRGVHSVSLIILFTAKNMDFTKGESIDVSFINDKWPEYKLGSVQYISKNELEDLNDNQMIFCSTAFFDEDVSKMQEAEFELHLIERYITTNKDEKGKTKEYYRVNNDKKWDIKITFETAVYTMATTSKSFDMKVNNKICCVEKIWVSPIAIYFQIDTDEFAVFDSDEQISLVSTKGEIICVADISSGGGGIVCEGNSVVSFDFEIPIDISKIEEIMIDGKKVPLTKIN